MIIYLLVFVVIAFMLYTTYSQQRRAKRAQEQLQRMVKKGDEVLTVGGMFGTVRKVGDDFVVLEVADRTKVRFLRRAIREIVNEEEDVEEDDEDEYVDDEYDEAEYDDDDGDEATRRGRRSRIDDDEGDEDEERDEDDDEDDDTDERRRGRRGDRRAATSSAPVRGADERSTRRPTLCGRPSRRRRRRAADGRRPGRSRARLGRRGARRGHRDALAARPSPHGAESSGGACGGRRECRRVWPPTLAASRASTLQGLTAPARMLAGTGLETGA